jgi:hypothetical protein
MIIFKFIILLSKEHKLKILEQIRQALIEGDELVDDVCRDYQAYAVTRSGVMSLNYIGL